MTEEKKAVITTLEEHAKEIKALKENLGQRRPILIEFCGSPKSGKSTSISSLNIFLKRNGFSTEIVTERAAVCPVENKTHPFFNSWTLFSSLAETIKLLSFSRNKVDIIIVDRCIFDALCWFEWLNTNSSEHSPYLDDKTYRGFRELFLETYMWYSMFDLTMVFQVNPNVSMQREYATLLTERTGSIMNENVLDSFNVSIKSCITKYSAHFQNLVQIDTTEKDPNQVGLEVTKCVLDKLKDILEEKIGFFNEDIREQLKEGINDYSLISDRKINYNDRKKVEASNDLQPVPIAVITNKERTKLLIVRKHPRKVGKGSPEKNRHLVYLGGHIRQEDEGYNQLTTIEILKNTIHRELQEEIGESYFPKSEPFLIYTPTSDKSRKHLAVCFIIETDLSNKRFKLTSDEFFMKSGTHNKSGHVLSIEELLNIEGNFEEWSIVILQHVFKVVFRKKQQSLFDDVF